MTVLGRKSKITKDHYGLFYVESSNGDQLEATQTGAKWSSQGGESFNTKFQAEHFAKQFSEVPKPGRNLARYDHLGRRANPRPRVAVLRNVEGYKDRAGKFHAAGARKTAVKKAPRKAARKNPAGFPVGKFVKVDAVRVNRSGTIDIMRSKGKRPKR